MNDQDKTKEQFTDELSQLRQRIAELEQSANKLKEAEIAAHSAASYAGNILDTLRDPLLVLDADLRIISANRSFHTLFKMPADEIIGSFIYDIGERQWDCPRLRKLLPDTLQKDALFDDFEVDHTFPTLGHKTMLLHARRLHHDETGRPRILLAIEDITERRQMENALREPAERYRSMFEHATDVIYTIRDDGTLSSMSPSAEQVIGWKPSELIGRPFAAIVHPEDLPRTFEVFQGVLSGEAVPIFNLRILKKSGEYCDAEISGAPLKHNTTHEIFGFARDVTERKRTEQALRESEEKFRAIYENSTDGIMLLTEKGFFDCSRRTLEIFGVAGKDEFIRLHPAELSPPLQPDGRDSFSAANEKIAAAFKEGQNHFEWMHRRKNGEDFAAEVFLTALYYGGKRVLQATVRDISERKKTEQRVELQVQRLSALREIDLAITSSLDLRLTLRILLEQVVNQLHVDAADVLLLDPLTQTLEYAGGRGFITENIQRTQLRLGEGSSGRAALERKTISIPDLSEAGDLFARADLLAEERFVSAFAVPLIAKGRVKGVLEIFQRSSLEPAPDWLELLETLSVQAAIAMDNASLFNELERSNVELISAYDTTLEGWSRALDYRDKETEGHSQRVTEMALRLARAMGMSDAELVHLRRGAPLP
ncbi:MAG: PAS domain S-box protein, partial [Thermodesulfovibrionales bacterium]